MRKGCFYLRGEKDYIVTDDGIERRVAEIREDVAATIKTTTDAVNIILKNFDNDYDGFEPYESELNDVMRMFNAGFFAFLFRDVRNIFDPQIDHDDSHNNANNCK